MSNNHPPNEFTPLLFSPSLSSPETPQRGNSSPLSLPPSSSSSSSPPYNFWLTHRRLQKDPLQEENDFEKLSSSSSSSSSSLLFPLPSSRKRIAMIIFAVISCFLLSGVIFGWAAVQQMLIDDGVYAYLCRPSFPFLPPHLHSDPNSIGNEPQQPQEEEEEKQGCPEQIVRFNLIYVVSSTLFSCALLPLGPFLDSFGPRAASTVGTCSVFCGFLLVSMSSDEFDGFMGGFVCIAVGGYTILLSSFHLGNLFPSYRGTIITTLNVSFDSSSIIFFFLSLIHSATSLTYHGIFLFYAAFPAFTLLFGAFLWSPISFPPSPSSPSPPPPPTPEDEDGYEDETLKWKIQEEKRRKITTGEEREGGSEKKLWKYLGGLVREGEFWLSVFYLVFNLLRCNMYIGTVGAQLENFEGTPEQVSFYTTLFVIILPVGGVLSIPLVGYLLDSHGTTMSIFAISGTGTIQGVLSLLVFLPIQVQLGSFVCIALFRALLFSVMTTYFFTKYGEKRFGVVFGIAAFIAGLGNLSEYFLVRVVLNQLEGHFFWVNVVLLVIEIFLFSFPIYLKMKDREEERRRAEEGVWVGWD